VYVCVYVCVFVLARARPDEGARADVLRFFTLKSSVCVCVCVCVRARADVYLMREPEQICSDSSPCRRKETTNAMSSVEGGVSRSI
jgi:hypothetical protein